MMTPFSFKFLKIFRWLLSLIIIIGLPSCSGPEENNSSSLTPKHPNILFIVVETFRADHLSCYGYERNTSPNIDLISRDAVRFAQAHSTAPWTNPSVVTLFSGYYPNAVMSPFHYLKPLQQVFPEQIDSLAEVLQRHGYMTAALIDHPGIHAGLQYDQGFEDFVNYYDLRQNNPTPGETVAPETITADDLVEVKVDDFFKDIKSKIEGFRAAKRPGFLYVHMMYPHFPYSAPQQYRKFGPGYSEKFKYTHIMPEEKDGLINMYDAEILRADDLIGRVWDYLKKEDLLDETVVIITADHAEAFWEHDFWEHGEALYNEVLHVPLIIYTPNSKGMRGKSIEQTVSSVDLFPTVMDLAFIQDYPEVDGKSLLRFFNSGIQAELNEDNNYVYSESPHPQMKIMNGSLQFKGYKLIFNPMRQTTRFYNLKTDPGEQHNLLPQGGDTTIEELYMFRHLSQMIVEYKRHNEERLKKLPLVRKPIDEQRLKQLQSLGYM